MEGWGTRLLDVDAPALRDGAVVGCACPRVLFDLLGRCCVASSYIYIYIYTSLQCILVLNGGEELLNLAMMIFICT